MVFMDFIPATAPNVLRSETNFYNYISIVDAYSKSQKSMVWKELLQNKWCMSWIYFNLYFWKIDEFVWVDLECISADVCMQFASTKFQEECQIRGVHLRLVAPEHQETNDLLDILIYPIRNFFEIIIRCYIILSSVKLFHTCMARYTSNVCKY